MCIRDRDGAGQVKGTGGRGGACEHGQRPGGKLEQQSGTHGGNRAVEQLAERESAGWERERSGQRARLELYGQPAEAEQEGRQRELGADGQGKQRQLVKTVGQLDQAGQHIAVRQSAQGGTCLLYTSRCV